MTSPSAVYTLFNGRIEIALFGKPNNWSLLDPTPESLALIGDAAQGNRIDTLLAPKPSTFNAKICLPEDLNTTFDTGNGVRIMRGVDADGVIVPEGQAFYLASADCVTIVATDPKSGMTIAAHGGRDCLIDRKRVNGEGLSREHDSVVDAIVAQFKNAGINAKHLKIFMTCGIGPKEFEHNFFDPKYGAGNIKMCLDLIAKWGKTVLDGDITRGKIVLTEVIRAQFMSHGVPAYQIGFDVVDTFGDTDADGQHRWWSNRRGDGTKRNAVIVKRVY